MYDLKLQELMKAGMLLNHRLAGPVLIDPASLSTNVDLFVAESRDTRYRIAGCMDDVRQRADLRRRRLAELEVLAQRVLKSAPRPVSPA